MKISPIANGSGTPGQVLGSVEIGRTASPQKLERAKALARGEEVPEAQDTQVERIKKEALRRITMRTQRSTNRDETESENITNEPVKEQEAPLSATAETNEAPVVEAIQPMSPQFAALAKQKRALQLERAQFEKEKATSSPSESEWVRKSDLLAKPLSVLQQNGVTYDQLTEAILNQSGTSPEIQELRAEIRALKEGVDKTLIDRDTQTKEAALGEMRKEADRLAKEGDTFELIRETGSIKDVINLIDRVYTEQGDVLDVEEAMEMIETELVKDVLKVARLKKVQTQIAPPPPAPPPRRPEGMRTLTARDSSSGALSARARAIAAFNGTLKR